MAWEVQQDRVTGVKAFLAAHPEAIKQANVARYNLMNIALIQKSPDFAKLLQESGVDVNLPDLAGLYPIHKAAMYGNSEVIKSLLNAGVSPNIETRNPGQATPLFFACQFDRTAAAKLLLDNGADIEVGRQFYRAGSGIEPHSPLYAAFDKTKDGATATLLIERGAKIDQTLPMGDQVLHAAARRNLPKLIEMLLAKGIDVNRPNVRKSTALEIAAETGAQDAVSILLKQGAAVTPAAIATAKKRGDLAVTELLNKVEK